MKYLITQELLSKLQNLSMPRHLMEELDELKPIEPISKTDISRLASAALNDTTDRFPNEVLTRAIEAHILGENT